MHSYLPGLIRPSRTCEAAFSAALSKEHGVGTVQTLLERALLLLMTILLLHRKCAIVSVEMKNNCKSLLCGSAFKSLPHTKML
jgi:hypothetical protein